ncbi:hypothetical protein ACTFIN_07270 [Clostridium cagae]|uniref:hypothetical protein n=1 Tax=Clostridium TaxID=1485 RepID=UPI00050421B5|nr:MULTISPECIES: hypothetical protein [unclassified Clostridium]AIY81080.1 hypothetical protein U728_1286 [Clostridium botulinum 202F]KAI3346942.1 hypothetical protein CIT17_08205 [Clostridium botulinum]KFX55525.1 hypothetical protein KU40_09995 [Clostridium botulinum]KON13715.1 hypothetical protein ACP50_06550 [Clostridium botulinum]MBY6777630.1 hypothetical protein [Clostridium botulinum]
MNSKKYGQDVFIEKINELKNKENFTLDDGIKSIKTLYDMKDKCELLSIRDTIDIVIFKIAQEISFSKIAVNIFKYEKFRSKLSVDQNKIIWYEGVERVGSADGIKQVIFRETDNMEEILIEKFNGRSIRINEKAFILEWE